jgi:hypothetical protein
VPKEGAGNLGDRIKKRRTRSSLKKKEWLIKLIIFQRDMLPLIYMSMFVSRTVAEAMDSSNSSLPWMKAQMNVRRRLQFLSHAMIGCRVSSVSDHFDLSRGNLGRGKTFWS